jgi:hypothetical protein
MLKPSRDALEKALSAAGTAHHDYEQVVLAGKRDELWPGFYAAYALGRLGDFAPASTVSLWLEEAPAGESWAAAAATYVLSQLGS